MKNLKDLIDSVEEKNQNTVDLEKKVENLRNTINRLRFTIKEQKRLIEDLKREGKAPQEDIPSDLRILKEIISNQRQNLNAKDNIISRFEDQTEQLESELRRKEEQISGTIDRSQYLDLKKRIESISRERDEAQNRITSLEAKINELKNRTAEEDLNKKLAQAKVIIEDLQREKKSHNAQIETLEQKIGELTDAQDTQKHTNRELTKSKTKVKLKEQENEKLSNKIESLREKIEELQGKTERKEQEKEELSNTLANLRKTKEHLQEKVERKEQEKEDLIGQVNYFQEELEKLKNKKLGDLDKSDLMNEIYGQFEKERGFINEKISNYEQRILDLEDLVEKKENQLQEVRKQLQETERIRKSSQITSQEQKNKQATAVNKETILTNIIHSPPNRREDVSLNVENIPQFYQKRLIEYMFTVMSENNKQRVIDFLIQNLNHKSPEIRRFSIKILSKVKTNKVFNALIDRISDRDWLVRYYLVKALETFKEFDGIKKVLKEYLNDVDVDVREAAKDALNQIL